ncbi:MAG: NAD(P)-binding domain-containing protein, partial [Limisphaerales bacterium]
MSAKLSIGFLGAGKMATALAKGFVQAGLIKTNQIIGSDPMDAARKSFAQETGGKIGNSNRDVLKFANVLI